MFVFVVYFAMLIYAFLTIDKYLHMLQQNLYNENNRYLKWIWKNKVTIMCNCNLLGILISFLILFSKNNILTTILMCLIIILYLFCYKIDKSNRLKSQNKKPLVYTKRIKRLQLTLGIIYIVPLFIYVLNKDSRLMVILSLLITFSYLMVFLANIINYPIEKCVYLYYKRKAKSKLASMKNLKIVGITGSYGKTTSKNILNSILNVKYNALATPKSLNTFNGLMITINNQLSKFDDIFIAEMGAYVKGEIHGLCKLVNPKYGIITTIGTAHLETFGSQENITSGKMELIEYLPSDGIGILNKDDINQRNYKIKNNCKIVWIGIESQDADVVASNIECNYKGCSFDCSFKGDDKKYRFETKLLGKHNVYNVLAGVALGREFGISIKDLQLGVKKVQVVEHRLEIKPMGSFYMIDDAYNSNPIGAKRALDVLNMMDGYKVVVTPGMIELGEKEDELNNIFGRQISEVADTVILIGEKKTKPIYKGLIDSGYNEKDIYVLNDVKEAYPLLEKIKTKKNLYALFENDLPDTYNE